MFSPEHVAIKPTPAHIVFRKSGLPATASFTLRSGTSFSAKFSLN